MVIACGKTSCICWNVENKNMERKRNNSQWICDSIEELIEEYELRAEKTYDQIEYLIYSKVIEELEAILYG